MIDAANAATLLTSLPTTPFLPLDSKGPMTDAQIDKAAKDFESMFVAQMLSQMFGESSGMESFGDSETDEIYKGLMMEEYGKQIAKSGGIGIADYVKRELLRLQEIEP